MTTNPHPENRTMNPEASPPLTEPEAQRRDAFAKRLFQTCLAALDIWAVYIGHHLGYYTALAKRGPLTSSELAAATGTHERYAREWLEQQAVTGILAVADPAADSLDRQYTLEPGHAEVLLDNDSLHYRVPFVRYYMASNFLIPRVLEAFRTGGGIPWPEMGDEVREAQEGFNRALFVKLLGTEDLPSVPDVDARLKADPPARVADLGCGSGWSSIAIARAYPKVRIDGFDYDPAVIDTARRNAAEAGVSNRVRFAARQADDSTLKGAYNLVTFFECLHDMSRPVEALRTAHDLLAAGGAVIVMDERAAEEFTAPGDDTERLMYGCSLVQCLPGGMAQQPSAGTGAVMRPATLRRYAAEAGLNSVEILPIETDPMRRWYRLMP